MTAKPSLNEPLPPDAIVGMTWGPFHYRKYPVFSKRWLVWRTLFASGLIIPYGGLIVVGHLVAGATPANALSMAGHFIVGCLLMASAGPALGTWVRHRQWPAKVESWAVIAAVVFGFVAAAGADYWSSMRIMEALGEKEIPATERKISGLDEAKIAMFNLAGGFIYFAVGGGLAALAYFSERRRLAARSQHLARLDADMRLAVLQAQVEPHFLFNALASIRPLIREDATRAEQALNALADHLRATIPQMRAQSSSIVSTLGQQVDICASYLSVMQVRMGGRLRFDIDVADRLRVLEFPPLMLLSLVENAIKHGIEPKPGPGSIHITASDTSGGLCVRVIDDGAGLKDGLSSGVGLANVREQLEVRYAGRASLKVAAASGGGTVAEIALPVPVPAP